MLRKEKQGRINGQTRRKGIPAGMPFEFQLGPVVESGALEFGVVQHESQPSDQVQSAAGGDTGSRDISRISRNIGLVEDDVHASYYNAFLSGVQGPSWAKRPRKRCRRKALPKPLRKRGVLKGRQRR